MIARNSASKRRPVSRYHRFSLHLFSPRNVYGRKGIKEGERGEFGWERGEWRGVFCEWRGRTHCNAVRLGSGVNDGGYKGRLPPPPLSLSLSQFHSLQRPDYIPSRPRGWSNCDGEPQEFHIAFANFLREFSSRMKTRSKRDDSLERCLNSCVSLIFVSLRDSSK